MVPKRMHSNWYIIALGWGGWLLRIQNRLTELALARGKAVHHHGHPAGGGAVPGHSGVGG